MSIKGDFGFEPENKVSLTGRVTGVSEVRRATFGGEAVTFTLYVPRLRDGGDQIECYALCDDACEIAELVKDGDVLHVEGEFRVNPKSRRFGVKVSVWWTEEGEIPTDPEKRKEALNRAERELERQRLSIGTLLSPPDMDGWESAAWTLAMLHGAAWEQRWAENGNGAASEDRRIARVYERLRGAKFPERISFRKEESGDV